jgi:hypothetical protein
MPKSTEIFPGTTTVNLCPDEKMMVKMKRPKNEVNIFRGIQFCKFSERKFIFNYFDKKSQATFDSVSSFQRERCVCVSDCVYVCVCV